MTESKAAKRPGKVRAWLMRVASAALLLPQLAWADWAPISYGNVTTFVPVGEAVGGGGGGGGEPGGGDTGGAGGVGGGGPGGGPSLSNAGFTPGEFSVGKSGAAGYTIPIVVPPGTAGMQPSLSLSYSSQGGNGPLGLGWSLGGFSVVTRCPATMAQDGLLDGVDLDSNDRFCLDGQRLVSHTSGTDDVGDYIQYRTEIDVFSRVRGYKDPADPSRVYMFKAWTKGGQTFEYAFTTDSRIYAADTSHVLTYAVSKIRDTVGNYISFEYVKSASRSTYYPRRVKYGGNDGSPATPHYATILFEVEDRPDETTGYVAGSRVQRNERIHEIHVYQKDYATGSDKLVSLYTLTYTNGGAGESRVTRIQQCTGTGKCFNQSKFTWNDTDGGWASHGAISNLSPAHGYENAGEYPFYFGDWNGDGRTDLGRVGETGVTFFTATASGGFTAYETYPSWSPGQAYWDADRYPVLMGDWNGDGLTDIGRVTSSGISFRKSTGDGWASYPTLADTLSPGQGFNTDTKYPILIGDWNGDGRTDVGRVGESSIVFHVSTGSGWEAYSGTISGWSPGNGFDDAGVNPILTGDFNGDGRTDVARVLDNEVKVRLSTGTGWTAGADLTTFTPGQGFANSSTYPIFTGDFNADGKTDIGRVTGTGVSVRLSTGAGWVSHPTLSTFSPTQGFTNASTYPILVGDWNGDGRTDFGRVSGSGVSLQLNRPSGWSAYETVTTWSPAQGYSNQSTYPVLVGDWDGDGIMGIGRVGGTSVMFRNSTFERPRITEFDNGLRIVAEVTYKPGTDSTVYTKSTGAVYPEVDIVAPSYLVSSVKVEGYNVGDRTTTYRYWGARANVEGRGLLGFSKMRETDSITGIYIETEYSQTFPFVGQVTRTKKRQSDGTWVADTVVTLDQHNPKPSSYLPYAAYTISRTYDAEGEPLTKVETTQTYSTENEKEYGHVSSVTVRTTDLTTGTPTAGQWFETVTSNDYYYVSALINNWFIGRLKCATVEHRTSTDTQTPAAARTRTSAFIYSTTTGLLTKEIVEPNAADNISACIGQSTDPTVRLATAYVHDRFGNRSEIKIGDGASAELQRTTTTSWGDHDKNGIAQGNGRFATGVVNALGHVETRRYHPYFGHVVYLKGPNLLETTWQYDDFGRLTKENRADGTVTQTVRKHCVTDCPGNAALAVKTITTGQPTTVTYADRHGRELRTETVGFGGQAIFVDTTYDSQSRVTGTTRPYFAGAAVVLATTTYDILSRPISSTAPGPGGALVTSHVHYGGLGIRTTNGRGHVNWKYNNARGDLVKALQGFSSTGDTTPEAGVEHTYDVFGNLRSSVQLAPGSGQSLEPVSATTITNSYDLRGRKIETADPDMGVWRYGHNVHGEITYQCDAWDSGASECTGNVTATTYDKLGRMVSRTDAVGDPAESTSTWVYDVGIKATGKLSEVQQGGVIERSFTYDSLGRPSTETHHFSPTESYTLTTDYDAAGRVATVNYPVSAHHTGGLTVRNVYDSRGYLLRVEDTAVTPKVYWTAQEHDAEARITTAALGNQLRTVRTYEPYTGTLTEVETGTLADPTSVQSDEYVFDAVGNLTSRRDRKQTVGGSVLREDFVYDTLNRVTSSTVLGQSAKAYGYDALGNLTNKGGVDQIYATSGTGVHPHRLLQSGSDVYTYDARGNQLTRNATARIIQYTPFNMPASIAAGDTVTFSYGAERERRRQVITSSGTAITYVDAAAARFEKEVVGSGGSARTTYLHHIAAAGGVVAVYKSISNAGVLSQETRYLHRDHLGSVAAVTDEVGAVVEHLSFDTWGQRRSAVGWTDGIPSPLPDETRRGYTGHEMLDEVGLVHMNGRVYDPVVGRFLSADPFVQFPENSQSLNRYSYAANNPLSFTDPSGYFLGGLFDFIGDALDAVVGFAGDVLQAISSVPVLSQVVQIGMCIDPASAAACLAYSSASTLANGGTFGDALLVVAQAAAFHAVGNGIPGTGFDGITKPGLWKTVAHGVVGGTFSELRGGSFLRGFVSSAVVEEIYPSLEGLDAHYQIVAGSVAGGLVTVIGGGKFADGALTGAFAYTAGQAARRAAAGRALTYDEINLGREAFVRAFGSDEGFDYGSARIIKGRFVFWQPRDIAITPNGKIYFPNDCGNLANCGGDSLAALFTHELTHVLQHQQGVNVLGRGLVLQAAYYASFKLYDPYALPRAAVPYSQLNIEQQAEYVTRTVFPDYVRYK